jgi:hypothetical protein
MSEDREVKFTRARCTRVAAIVNMMWLGPINSYELKKKMMRNREFRPPKAINLRCATDLMFGTESRSVGDPTYRSVR